MNMTSVSFYDVHPRRRRQQFKRRRRITSMTEENDSEETCTFCQAHRSNSNSVSTVSAHTASSGNNTFFKSDDCLLSKSCTSLMSDSSFQLRPYRRKLFTFLIAITMSLVIGAVAAALATFMYNIPIMQRVEVNSLETTLRRNLYCQESAINAFVGHIREYINSHHTGVVLLHLEGSEGTGKTLTVDTVRQVNHRWKKLVATFEQGELNTMPEEALIATLRNNIHKSTLNFLFVDDVPSLNEETPFVEKKLKPILKALNTESKQVFVVITTPTDMTELPEYLTAAYEHRTVHFSPMSRECVQKCVEDVFYFLDTIASDEDLAEVMNGLEFEKLNGKDVSLNGCKTVPVAVALRTSSRVRKTDRQLDNEL